MTLVRDAKENCFKISSPKFNPNIKFNYADNTVYELPDRTNLVIGKEGSAIPEMIFGNDNQRGIQNMLFDCINKLDLNVRKDVMSNIIITGGTTCTRTFFDRL